MIAQDDRQIHPRMLVSITRAEHEKKLEEVFDTLHIPIYHQCRGQGTAPSEIMDIFGFSGTTRLITITFLPKFKVQEVFEKMEEGLEIKQKGRGICFTIPVTGLQNHLFQMLNEEARDMVRKRTEGDVAEVREKAMYSVIWVSVAAGYSDEVVDAAREAGAKGGTVIRGRRRCAEQVAEYMGMHIQDEQDFVMIVVPKEKKTDIMSAITSFCGLKTEAHGIVLSLPVDEVFGLEYPN